MSLPSVPCPYHYTELSLLTQFTWCGSLNWRSALCVNSGDLPGFGRLGTV